MYVLAVASCIFIMRGPGGPVFYLETRHFGRVYRHLDGFGWGGQSLKYPLLDGQFLKKGQKGLKIAKKYPIFPKKAVT